MILGEMRNTPSTPSDTDTLATIWEVPDALWEKIIVPVLNELDLAAKTGRPRADQRKCLNAILYRARTGCQWNHLPAELGNDATVHRTLKRWEHKGVFDAIWALLIYHCEELKGVHWQWQAADGCLDKARFIGKKGTRKPVKLSARSAASAPIPRTGASWASRPACLSKQKAGRLLCVSPEPM